MDIKPTKELMNDLREHLGWRYLEQWISEKQDGIKNSLLREKDIEQIRKLQTEFEVYQTILNKVKSLSEKGH